MSEGEKYEVLEKIGSYPHSQNVEASSRVLIDFRSWLLWSHSKSEEETRRADSLPQGDQLSPNVSERERTAPC